MRILDLDMDYFMEKVADNNSKKENGRLIESEFRESVWSEQKVRSFFENNLGLSKAKKIRGKVLTNHNEALFFWEELIQKGLLTEPFEVIHIDSHADLGFGDPITDLFVFDDILKLPKTERRKMRKLYSDKIEYDITIGNYLLWTLVYGYVNKLV